jgi:DNA-binding response OmpR family regulator
MSQVNDAVILVIEDDVHIGGLVAQVLREAGYKPEIVRDVGAARALAVQGLRPAAMLSDLMIAGSAGPERLPGELEAMFPGVPLTLMTGVPPKRRAAMGVTHERVLEKPFELEALLAAVGVMLRGP